VPNCITVGSYSTYLVRKVNLGFSPFYTRSKLYAPRTSNFVHIRAFTKRFNVSFINGRGYQFFIVLLLISR
jgi:hypothetical protein